MNLKTISMMRKSTVNVLRIRLVQRRDLDGAVVAMDAGMISSSE
jgi:hypothetical protein